MSKGWTIKDMISQQGKRIIVTGATSGIGFHMALELARAGAEVTLPGRTQKKAEDAIARIRTVVPQAKLKPAVMDLSSKKSVEDFAANQLEDKRPIDILINNAGIMAPVERKISADGYEMQFATNVLGPFLLTGLLLPLILKASHPRVVNVSSSVHGLGGPVPVEDLNSEKSYVPNKAYAKTKLGNVLFTRELQRRAGERLLVASCHPGYARTNLQFRDEPFLYKVGAVVFYPFSQSASGGARPALLAATSPDAKPAAYYGPRYIMRGPAIETEAATIALNDSAAKQWFDELETLACIRYEL